MYVWLELFTLLQIVGSIFRFKTCIMLRINWYLGLFIITLFCPHRWVHCDDCPLPPEEEDWLFCDSDVPAMHHDRHPVAGVLLAEPRVCSSPDCFWWVSSLSESRSSNLKLIIHFRLICGLEIICTLDATSKSWNKSLFVYVFLLKIQMLGVLIS